MMVDLVSLKIRSAFENLDGYSKAAKAARSLARQFERTEAATRGEADEAENLAAALGRLAQQKQLIGDFRRLSEGTEDTAEAMRHAKREVEFLRRGMAQAGKGGAKLFANDLERAKKKVVDLAKSQTRYLAQLKTLRPAMAAAGISAANLADQEERVQRETEDTRSRIDRLSGSLKKLRTTARKPLPDATRNLRSGATDTTNALSSLRTQVLGLLSVAGLKRLSANVLTAADSWKRYTAQLGLATDSAVEQAQAERGLFGIAQDTRTGLEANIQLYARLARSRKELNLSQDELLETTDLLARGLKISGATAAEAESTMLQLSQALGAGALQGEELRAVLENGGRVAKALADGLGVPIGALKELGAQGELTSRKVIDALLSQKTAIDTEFRTLPQTVEGSLTKIANEYQRFIGQSEGVGVATQKVIGLLEAVADNFDEVAELALRAGEVIIAAFAVKGVAAIRTYVAELIVATAATNTLTTATTAQAAAQATAAARVAKFGVALKSIGWTAALFGAQELISRIVTLRKETQTTEEILEENSNKLLHQASTVELYSAAIAAGVKDTREFIRQVREGSLVFDETAGKWKAGAEVLDTLALNIRLAGRAGKEAAQDFETDLDVKNSFFAQMAKEIKSIGKDSIPEYLRKIGELRQANLITEEHLHVLRLVLVELDKQIDNTGGVIEIDVKKSMDGLTSFSDARNGYRINTEKASEATEENTEKAKENTDITRLSVDEYVEHRQATRAAAEAQRDQGAAATEAGNATEVGARQTGGASSIMAKMIELIGNVRQQMAGLSQGALEMFNNLISGWTRMKATGIIPKKSTDEIKQTAQEIRRLTVRMQSATRGIGEWFQAVLLSAARTKKAFLEQEKSAKALLDRLGDMDGASQNVIRQAQSMADGYALLDQQTLSRLQSEVDRLTAANERMEESARSALERLQDRVDPEGRAARQAARDKVDLERQYQEAVQAGNIEAQKLLKEALDLQRQHHLETLGQLEEEEDARRDALYPKEPLQLKSAQSPRGQGSGAPSGDIPGLNRFLPATPQSPTEDFLEKFRRILERWKPPETKIYLNEENIVERIDHRMRRDGGAVAEARISDAAVALGHR